MSSETTPDTPPSLQERYDQLWTSAAGRTRSGDIEIDPVLARGQSDRRRGLTLLFRPSPPVVDRVESLLNEIRGLEPEQHYYQPSELHSTFLTLFTAVVDSARFFARQDQYIAAARAAAASVPPFTVEFRGVTASPATILVQGFPESGALEAGREALRQELRQRNLAEGLDTRYRLATAHMTAVRFRAPLRNGAALTRFLEQRRSLSFGRTEVSSLALVSTDWYMSSAQCREVLSFPLARL
jgi:2'-5' RNA ligase